MLATLKYCSHNYILKLFLFLLSAIQEAIDINLALQMPFILSLVFYGIKNMGYKSDFVSVYLIIILRPEIN